MTMTELGTRKTFEETLALLRERYRASMPKTIDMFRHLAGQLDSTPADPTLVEQLRRELHRIHGGAGSFGFPATGKLAGEWERQAVTWERDATLDTSRRGQLIRKFTSDLAAVFEQEETTAQLQGASLQGGGPQSGVSLDAPPRHVQAQNASLTPVGQAAQVPEQIVHAPVPDVVVVEDDTALADIFKYALESMALRVTMYHNGSRALEALRTMGPVTTPVLVLLDIDLPGLDGHSLHERLRVDRPGDFAVVFISARGTETDQLRALHTGAIDYLIKPVNLKLLLAKLPNWRTMLARPK